MLNRPASEQRAWPHRGVGSMPAPGGRCGHARRVRRAEVTTTVALLPTVVFSGTHADQFADIPDGPKVILFSPYEDPNVVTSDPDTLTETDLARFSTDLRNSDNARVAPVTPRLAQWLQGRKRA